MKKLSSGPAVFLMGCLAASSVPVAVPVAILGTVISAQQARAQAANIAAVVNGEVITTADVANRARLLALSTGMQATPDVLDRLKPQIIQQLIDQTLQMQEMTKLKVSVPETDIAQAVTHIEQGNGLPPGGLRMRMQKAGVSFQTLIQQIRTQLGWQAVLHQVLGPNIQPTPGDLRAEKAALNESRGSTQYHLSEIFIPVTDPANDSSAKNFANTVIGQLRSGAPFPVVAAQFSQAPTALQGGDLGFMPLSQLDPNVAATVTSMPVGAVSNPIRVPGGYEIVQLQGTHVVGSTMQTTLSIRQVFAPYPSPISNGMVGPAQVAVITKLVNAAKSVHSCDDMTALNNSFGKTRPADPGPVDLATVTPPTFQTLLSTLPVGKVSEPLVAQDGVSVVMVCSRSSAPAALPSDDQISGIIIEQRVQMESQQLLDSLRHQSVITQN